MPDPDHRKATEEAARILAASGDVASLLGQVSRVVTDRIGDGCIVTLLDADGLILIHAAVAHRDPALETDYARSLRRKRVAAADSSTISAQVIRTGEAKLVPLVNPAQVVAMADNDLKVVVARLNVHSFVVVPIRTSSGVAGTLSMLRSRPGTPYTPADRDFLEDLAVQVGKRLGKEAGTFQGAGPA